MKPIFFLFIISLIFSQSKSVLFLGNSLTYSNNLPQIVELIGAEFSETIETTSLCYPNYAIEDHWNDGKLQKLLREKKFDFVIIQQGPSSQLDGRQMLFDFGEKIQSICKKTNTTLAYFMVWPSKQYYFTFDGVIKNYSDAAKENDADLIPVGIHWKDYSENSDLASLYSRDQFHPSEAGSFLAGLTIFNHMFPKKNLSKLNFEFASKWVAEEKSLKQMLRYFK